MDEDDDEENDEIESSSSSSLGQIEVNLKSMQFRSRRGTKMQSLLDNKEEDEDDFWKENKYFGKAEDIENVNEEED